jgi:hypothetical protein
MTDVFSGFSQARHTNSGTIPTKTAEILSFKLCTRIYDNIPASFGNPHFIPFDLKTKTVR